MKKKLYVLNKKQLLILTFVLLVLGICLELLVTKKVIIAVDESYINSIYVSLVTISTLSVTIITIIISSLSDKCFGLKIKEIINQKNDYFKISFVIPFVLISVLVATVSLALVWINIIVTILVIISIFIINFSIYIWKVTIDEKFCKTLVLNYIHKCFLSNPLEITYKLFSGVNDSLNNNNLYEALDCVEIVINQLKLININEEKYQKLINVSNNEYKINNSEYDSYFTSLDKYIRESFILAEKKFGLIIAINEILIIYSEIHFEKKDERKKNRNENKIISLIEEVINKYQYVDALEIQFSQILNVVNSLYNVKTDILDEKFKALIIFRIFNSIYDNGIIEDSFKKAKLNEIINKLMGNYSDNKNGYFQVKYKALLYIFDYYILLNEDQSFGAYLMGKLSLALYNKTVLPNETIFDIISIIYFVIYLYSKHEEKELSTSQMKYIKQLIGFCSISINKENYSFKSILSKNFDRIYTSLINLDKNFFNQLAFFEYFRSDTVVSSTVITFSANKLFEFAIYNYFLNWHDTKINILNVDFWDTHESDIENILFMFDKNTELLKDKYKKEIIDLANWVNIVPILNEDSQKIFFKKLKSIKSSRAIKELSLIQDKTFDLEKLNLSLNTQFIENKMYNYLPNQKSFLQENEYKFYFIINQKYINNEKDFAINLFLYFKEIINKNINMTLDEEILSFDLAGVEKLLSILEEKKVNKYNYEYINDLAFTKSVIEKTDFKKLKERINSLSYIETPLINSRLYFIDNALDFNIKIIRYEKLDLSENEINNYLETYKISENIFDISGAYVDRNKAIAYIKMIHIKYFITYVLKANLTKGSGFRINFDYKRFREKAKK